MRRDIVPKKIEKFDLGYAVRQTDLYQNKLVDSMIRTREYSGR